MKNSLNNIKETIYYYYGHICELFFYGIKHPIGVFVILASVLLSFGRIAFCTDYYVDSEVVINIPGTSYNWLEIGRYGLVFVKKILGTEWYNPYYTGVLLVLFLVFTGITLSYLFQKLFPRIPRILCMLGSILFLTYPTFTEQYYFHFQSAEMAFGLWISVLNICAFYLFVKEGRWGSFFITIPIYVLTFSIYQSFIPVALCGYLLVFLSISSHTVLDKSLLKRGILGSALHFILSFLLSQGIHKIFFESSNYLSDQVVWLQGAGFVSTLYTVLKTCFKMFIGYGLFYTSIMVFAVGIVLLGLFLFRKHHQTISFVMVSLSLFGMLLSPFLLTMLLGETTAARTQFVYSLAAVSMLLWGFEQFLLYAKNTKYSLYLSKGFLTILMVLQIINTNFIWNIHEEIIRFDKETSLDIMYRFYDSYILNDKGPVILWGSLQPETEYDSLISTSPSYLFLSVFNLEHDKSPYCFYSTIRVLGYMESMGHVFTLPTHENQQLSAYLMNREEIPAYPHERCAYPDTGILTFHLGNCPDYYY